MKWNDLTKAQQKWLLTFDPSGHGIAEGSARIRMAMRLRDADILEGDRGTHWSQARYVRLTPDWRRIMQEIAKT